MKWKRWPYWLKGGIVGVLYLVVLVPLSGFCPDDMNCFTNVFIKPLFYPFLAISSLFPETGNFLRENIFPFLLAFWFVFGSLMGLSYGFWLKSRKEKKVGGRKTPFYTEEDEGIDEDEVPKPDNQESRLPELEDLKNRET